MKVYSDTDHPQRLKPKEYADPLTFPLVSLNIYDFQYFDLTPVKYVVMKNPHRINYKHFWC